jgi:hypothetical protein
LTVQQAVGLDHVVDAAGRATHRVRQARFGIGADVRLHPEEPLVALLRLLHLRVALAHGVLRRTRRGNQRGVHHRAGLQQQPLVLQQVVDRLEHLRRRLVLLQQVAKPQDG